MGTWWGENDVVEDEDIDIDVCVAADGDLWVSVGSAGAPIGKFSVESEHDLANMVTDFLENAGSFGADSWCSSDSESCLSDFSHLAEKIQVIIIINCKNYSFFCCC
ncbi:unnamed protein product [Trifolium pratense]|uniref:Uncharacterized protein n=2 Tax=Trifolium pratense TaxID=57577 RepID=A0ACB0I812_TRIPR|nr:unnamed protein product [Trifolium pratense]